MFAFFISLESWKEGSAGEPLTPYGLFRCIGLVDLSPSPASPCSTICRAIMLHNVDSSERSFWWYHLTRNCPLMGFSDITEELIYVSIHLTLMCRWSHACWLTHRRIFVSVGKGIHSVFCNPALGVKRGEGDLIQALSINVMLLWPEDIHAVAEGLLTEESLSVLLVPDVLLHNVLFHALGLLDANPGGFEAWGQRIRR